MSLRASWVALVATAVSLLTPSLAGAAVASCANTTGPWGPTGPDAGSIQQLDQDAAQNCQAITDRLDQLHADLGTANGTAKQEADALNGVNGAIGVYVTGPTGSTGPTGPQTVELGPVATANIDGAAHGLHIDLWFILGALVGCFAIFWALTRLAP